MRPAPSSSSPAEFSRGFDTPTDMLDLPGGRVAYYRFGTGPDVVCVHGWPLHAATFRRLLPALTRHFTVHLLDLPGTGHTRWKTPAGLGPNLEALRQTVAHLSLSRYGLLAHDSGGLFARQLAADNPAVRALVLAGTEIPDHFAWQLGLYLAAGKIPGAHHLFGAALQVGPLRRSGIGFGGCFTDPTYADGEFGDLFVRPLARPEVMLGQMGLLRNLDPGVLKTLPAVHARILCPTLCLWGERDPFFPVEKARAMLPQFAGGARLVSIPQGRLFVHEDHPEVFDAQAVPFLVEHLGPAA